MSDQAQAKEKTHILWATNMDDDGYADLLFLVGEESPYGVGINCGGHVVIKPLRGWHKLAISPPDATKEQIEAVAQAIRQTFEAQGFSDENVPGRTEADQYREMADAAIRAMSPQNGTLIAEERAGGEEQ